jgi:pimeloyl-ACP methyl ester carboxylesterase
MHPPTNNAGMDDGFRTGGAHARDVAAVVKDLRSRFSEAKIFLIGTSRGSLSAAYVGRSLGDAVDGVILTSSVFYGARGGIGLSGFDFGGIKSSVLFVHHLYDGCRQCPYRAVESLGRRYPLVTVSGGKPAESDPCEALGARLFRQGGGDRERDEELDAGAALSQGDRLACAQNLSPACACST